MSQDTLWFDTEEFSSMTGFHAGLRRLAETGIIRWTNTATDTGTGGIHGLRYKVEKDEAGSPVILLQHWVHWPGGKAPPGEEKKRQPDILTFRTETRTDPEGRAQIRPKEAVWMGKSHTDPADLMKFMHLLQGTAAEIRSNIAKNTEPHSLHEESADHSGHQQTKRRDEIPNLYALTRRCGLRVATGFEGMRSNGEFSFGEEAVPSDGPPSYPLQLVRSMLALEENITQHGGKTFSRSHTVPNADTRGYEGVTYGYTPDDTGFETSCRVWSTNAQGVREETLLYKTVFRRDAADKNMVRLESMEMLGDKPDLSDHKGVARAIRAMKYIHLAIQRGEAPLFSDIIDKHDLKPFLRRPMAPVETAEKPRTLVQVFGANTDAVFTEREKGIGSNGLHIVRDFMKDGQWVRQGIGVDWGVTFGDAKNTYYNTIAHNYGRFLHHPASPHIKPFAEPLVNLETHEHEDHLRGVARVAKFGYTMPPAVMNAHTCAVYKTMMQEEGVRKDKVAAIMERCLVVEINRYKAPANPQDITTHEYGDTIIEQGTETLWSESEKTNKYFPLLTIYSKQNPEAKTRVRVGPAGHSAHALMFEVEGVLYTGDYKLDQTMKKDIRTDLDWLEKCKEAAVHVQECTNATKEIDSNPTTLEVKKNRKKILRHEHNQRIFYTTVGSNASDIQMYCEAAGEVRQEIKKAGVETPPFDYIIFGGAAIRRKYGHLNKTHDLKFEMEHKYDIKTLHISSKKAKALLSGKEEGSFTCFITGTQDEALSLTHRISRDLHDLIRLKPGDVIVNGQNPIPVKTDSGRSTIDVRRDQNNRYRHDFGCTVYDAAELATKGHHIYASSHASRDDVREVHKRTGNLLKLLHHGGPYQLTKGRELLEGVGARVMIPDKQVIYRVNAETKSVEVAGETPEERVGYREIRDDPEEFMKKQRQQATVNRVKDHWHGPVAEQMYRFETTVRKRDDSRHALKDTARGANIAEDFNEIAVGGKFPPIGILHPEISRPYYEKHKNIKLFIGMDTETTGVNPALDVHTDISFVAASPDGKILGEKTLRHALPKYMMPAAMALGVTKNNNPANLYKGLKLRQYVHKMRKIYREWPEELTGEPHAKALFFGFRNGVFDDPITMRMMGMALAANDMKPMATHGNMQLDVYNLYTAMIALAPDRVGAVKDKQGNYVRTLEAACKSNGVEYNPAEAHGSLYDSHCTMKLLLKLRDISPDIFDQMLMNCDFGASRASPMIDQILGQNIHLNDHATVFGYVDMRDRTCKPRLGALVTIDTVSSKATDAIVIDLAKADIPQLEQLSDEQLTAWMNDPAGPFSVVKLNRSPPLFPPQFIWNDPKLRHRAVGGLPQYTLRHRADALKHMRAPVHGVGNNLIQRVQRLYPKTRLCFSVEREAFAHKPANNNPLPSAKPFRLPNDRIFSLFGVMKGINQIRSRHKKAAATLLHSLQPSDEEFKPKFRKESFWKKALKEARRLSTATSGSDPQIEDVKFLVEWLVYDINPQWLPKEDRYRMNAMKSAMLHGPDNSYTMTVDRFHRELEDIGKDPAKLAKVIGEGKTAEQTKKAWSRLKKTYDQFAHVIDDSKKFAMTEGKREILREHRRDDARQGGARRFGMA